MDLGPPELVTLLVAILGGSKLPQLARNLGTAQQEFKHALAEGNDATGDEHWSK